MEEQNEDSIRAGEGEQNVKKEDIEVGCQGQTDMPEPDAEVEDHEDLPHSEILDIFEEGLAQLVQDPLLCDLPIQVPFFICPLCFILVMTTHSTDPVPFSILFGQFFSFNLIV